LSWLGAIQIFSMFKVQKNAYAGDLLIGLSVLILAVAAFYFSVSWSFRLPEEYSELAWKINFDRVTVVFAAGFALTMSLASKHYSMSIARQFSVYVLVVFATAGFVLGLIFTLPLVACLLTALIFGVLGFSLSNTLKIESSIGNLALGFSLYLTFFISALVYLAALVYADGIGEFALWLLSDVNRVGVNGYLAFALVFVLAFWAAFDQQRELPTLLLLGVSLGLLGPIMFVGCVIPMLVKHLDLSARAHTLVSGLFGGIVLLVMATSSNLIFGGYAPALIVPLGFVGIPILLWLNRTPEKGSIINVIEVSLILVSMLVSIVVLNHLAAFAQSQA